MGRPTVGWANFDVASLNPSDDQSIAMQLGVATHEISHALGFSYSTFSASDRFKTWDSNGNYQNYPPNSIVQDFSASSGVTGLYGLITPAVVREAKAHFDCDSLAALYLEPNGGAGTARSHWWKQILFSECSS
jgi:hypothetical protein